VNYDPDKLRQLLLGSDADKEQPSETDKDKPTPTHVESDMSGPGGSQEAPERPVPPSPVEAKPSEPLSEKPLAPLPERPASQEPSPTQIDPWRMPAPSKPEPVQTQAAPPSSNPAYETSPAPAREPVKTAADSPRSSSPFPRRSPDLTARAPYLLGSNEKPTGKPEPEPKPDPPTPPHSNIEPPDELENVPAGDFAPLREALLSHSGQKTEEDESSAAGVSDAPRSDVDEPAVKSGEKKGRRATEPKPPRPQKPITPPSPISYMVLIGGGVSLGAATIALGIGQTGTPVLGLGAIGFALVIAFSMVNRRWLRASLSTRSARYSANITVAILSLLGIVIFANILSYRYHYRLDLSSEGLHSLSPQTIKVLDNINRAGDDITVIAFAPPKSRSRQVIEGLVDLYLYRSSRLKFSFADPDVQRELAESKGITTNPSVLFELGGNRSIVSDMDEPHFTSALMAVRQNHTRLVSFLTGHGEPDPFSDDGYQTGLSLFRKQLELEGYEANILGIPEANGVPAETNLVVIASPERDLEPQEISAIEEYLDSGGNLACFLEPGRTSGLETMLAEYGIGFRQGIVVDDEHNAYSDPMSPIAVGNPKHPITAPFLEDGLLFLNAGGLSFTSTTRLPDVQTESLVNTWPSSWIESSDSLTFDQGIDTREAVNLAVLATRTLESPEAPAESESGESQTGKPESEKAPSSPEAEAARVAQVLVVDDCSFVQNANLDRNYNKDFAMNAVNYLTAQHDLISIRPAQRMSRPLDLSPVQKSLIFMFSVIITPLMIAGLGGIVWWRRR